MEYLPSNPALSPLIVFGALLLLGSLGGYLAHRVSWMPSITGFMAIGALCGPSGLGIFSASALADSRIFIDVALALILYRLGLSLEVRKVLKSREILLTTLIESFATFLGVFAFLYLCEVSVPVALLVAAISISSSPAVLLHVGHEVGAEGPLTEKVKTLVASNNLISFVVFSTVLPFVHLSAGSDWLTLVIQPTYRLAGSFLLGCVIALVLHQIGLFTQKAAQYKLALVIGAVMVGLGLAIELKLSTVCVPLVIGAAVKWMEKEIVISDLAFGPSFELFFIVLFVSAGANLHLHELIEYAPVVIGLVLVRSFFKVGSISALTAYHKEPVKTGFAGGLLLIPMAGLAIGLVQTSTSLFPQYASPVSAIVLGAVTLFETFGPPVAAKAFWLAGETSEQREAQQLPNPVILEDQPELS